MAGDDIGLEVAARLLAGIRARERVVIGECFADDARLRVLTPKSLRELDGRAAIVERYAAWLEPLEPFALLAADAEVIADRVRIRYRFHGLDASKGWQENEHTAYATVEDGLIAALNVSCAGFRPAEPR